MRKNHFLTILKSNKTTFFLGQLVKVIVFNYSRDIIKLIRIKLVQSGLLPNREFEYLKLYKDKYFGKRCFIVATGPSLKLDDLELIKEEYSFGVNSVVKAFDKTAWRPTFYGIQDPHVYEKLEKDILSSDLDHKSIFVGHNLADKFVSAHRYKKFYRFSCFHNGPSHLVPVSSDFSFDISEVVYDGYSITYSMLQLAVYMGFKEIYLLGTDCNYNQEKKQFVDYGFRDRRYKEVGELMIYAFEIAKRKLSNREVEVINATTGGMLNTFSRVDLSSVLKK